MFRLNLGLERVKPQAPFTISGANNGKWLSLDILVRQLAMEFMASLQNGFDDEKPSLFGITQFQEASLVI